MRLDAGKAHLISSHRLIAITEAAFVFLIRSTVQQLVLLVRLKIETFQKTNLV